jgi:hypothetical protein
MHSPFIVDRPTFERHQWFANLQPLELVWGQPIGVKTPPAVPYLEQLIGVEAITIRLLGLLKQRATRSVKVRSFLCQLHALRYSLKLARLGTGVGPEAWALLHGVAGLRASWFRLDKDGRDAAVQELCERAGPALYQALAGIGSARPLPSNGSLTLRRPWSNVTLVGHSGDSATPAMPEFRLMSRLPARFARLAELHWRLGHYRLVLPAGALDLLCGPRRPVEVTIRHERDRIVGHYRAFLAECASGWSGIDFARTFLPAG